MELTRLAERGPVTGSRILAEVYDEAEAKRIIACLETSKHLPTEALVHGSLGDAYADVMHQRNVLLIAAENVAGRRYTNDNMDALISAVAMVREAMQ